MPLTFFLKDAEETLALGRALAAFLRETEAPPAILLQGGLGSGKTTLVRGLVESLPGADEAEVSSPSFNIFNLYPTEPVVAHFDLYRLEGMPPGDEVLDQLAGESSVAVVEWVEYLPRSEWPEEALHLVWEPERTGRVLVLHAMGNRAGDFLDSLGKRLGQYIKNTESK
ncbi:tRNA (adenosine(37)-N6)-threonylcarbamoyltransferase complex ATPase subunit type 1 TsaE [Salidesulfovibrio brasiliensis]|uniref:tRNA (adenosine(37)-N6)-threonylcarbamoyltransferase complex ATPase subunit type 1 TsaE n=1 Tax=Salidesulfovibrio brasiliensis TaxID=221711 RepID=UPI0006CF237D|nr:tRNA (adenosine(37)-N6)-threonylcarbamoyltransferase complex ATPase subunit type 1 TsaE [Salidesulfovibrio brasiliensis]